MTAAVWTLAAWLGAGLLAAAALLAAAEGVLRVVRAVDRRYLSRYVSRKDFLAPAYQDYVNWVEDWRKPMFEYVPVGLRVFNNDNPIPGRVRTNSLGFRCDEFTPPDPDELTIALLGGSAAWGSGASTNEATIAGQLERLLNADRRLLGRYRRARCFNLGQVNGYQTQDVLTMLFVAPRIKPDVVLSFTGWNELMANESMRRAYLDRFGVFYMEEMEGWEPLGVVGNKTRLLKDALRLWGRDRFELARRFIAPGPGPRQARRPLAESLALGSRLFVEHLVTLHRLSTAYGFTHIQFMQPYLYRKRRRTADEQRVVELYDEVRPVHGGKPTGDYLRQHNIYLPVLEAAAEGPDPTGPIVDLCDLFADEGGHIFYTLVHLTDAGYRMVAERMHEALRNTMEKSTQSAQSSRIG